MRPLKLSQLGFAWPGQARLLAIDCLTLEAGESVLLKGPSGCGKSTLLQLLSGVCSPDQGAIEIFGHNLSQLSASRRDQVRADHLGFIFQQFNLLPFLTVLENVKLGCKFSKRRKQRAEHAHGSVEQSAQALLAALDLPPALYQRQAYSLSIGQQQRVAAARALIGAPELIIADEPTSALDTASRDAFLALLLSQCHASKAAVLMVSHDPSLARLFDRDLSLAELNQATFKEALRC